MYQVQIVHSDTSQIAARLEYQSDHSGSRRQYALEAVVIESLAHRQSLCHRLQNVVVGSEVPVHHGCPLGLELAVKQTKSAEKQTFRPLHGRRFKSRHATGNPLDPKVFEAHLKARYLGQG